VKDDLPVFVKGKEEAVEGGIPVASEAEAAMAKRRYLLADAKWTELD
jgi:hypothetical protein